MSLAIASIIFTDEGVLVTYMDPVEDVRNRGLLVRSLQMHIAVGEGGKDYGDEIEDLKDAAKRLLADALDDFQSTLAVENDPTMAPMAPGDLQD